MFRFIRVALVRTTAANQILFDGFHSVKVDRVLTATSLKNRGII